MKKHLFKGVFFALILSLLFSMLGCTYRAEGSVIQEVDFTFVYEDDEGEREDIDATLKLYKTFAPKTCDRILSLIKDGYYENTNVVTDKTGAYLVLGTFTMTEGEYQGLVYEGETLKGEFVNAGMQSRLKAETGSLVMLREPDTDKGAQKYDSAKASFAILLEPVDSISNEEYCVFGKIDSDDLEDLQEMRDELYKDADGDIPLKCIAERDENDELKVVDGKYVGGFDFYLNFTNSELFKLVNGQKVLVEEKLENEEENPEYKKLTEINSFDGFAIPAKPIKVKNFKVK